MAQLQPLDRRRWIGLWHRLGAQGDGLSVLIGLEAAYAESARTYHTADHIRDCLAQFDLCPQIATRPDEVEAAIWFHDGVYQPGASDNEDMSARLARTSLAEAGASLEVADRIAELVLATEHLSIPEEPDASLLCDVDLSILGRTADVFDKFERRIRQEYSWVPEPAYRSGRTRILKGFLARHSIFQTDFFRERYEAAARANVARIVEELGG